MKFPLIEIYWLKLHQHACESFYWLIRIRLRRKLPINSVGPEIHAVDTRNALLRIPRHSPNRMDETNSVVSVQTIISQYSSANKEIMGRAESSQVG